MAKETRLITPPGRLAWPSLFKPRQRTNPKTGKPEGEPKFELTLIFDEAAQKTPEYQTLRKAVLDLAGQKFGHLPQAIKSKVSLPFGDGATKVDEDGKPYPGYGPGTVFVKATSKIKPDVCGGAREPLGEGDVYAGCYARASLVPFDYDNSGNKGITFGLRNVQKTGDGEPFAQGVKAADEFAEVANYTAKPAASEFGTAPVASGFAEQMSGTEEENIPF